MHYKLIDNNSEMITPTGAAILRTYNAQQLNESPEAKRSGFGAGTKDFDFPNVLKASVIDSNIDEKLLLETNIDDMSPELFPYVIERLIEAGAVDAFISPSYMKKGRIGTLISVICNRDKKKALVDLLFSETTTIGVRSSALNRTELPREIKTIKTKYGNVNLKVSGSTIKPEYEDLKKIAMKKKIPLRDVYREVLNSLK